MSSEPGASAIRLKIRLDLVLAALVLALLAVLAFLARNPPRPAPAFDVLNPSLRFIGVRPDAGDMIYDAGGKPRLEEPYEGNDLGPWATNVLRRDFIFEWDGPADTAPAASFTYWLGGYIMGQHACKVYQLPGGGHRVVAEIFVPRLHHQRRFIFKSKPAPAQTVDIGLYFFDGGTKKELARCRRVRIHYPELPYRNQAECAARLAAHLGRAGADATRPDDRLFQTPQQALGVLDWIRGPQILKAWQTLNGPGDRANPGLDLASLDPAVQAKVRQGAWAWTLSPNEGIRAMGASLGLKAHWPEFVEPALDLLRLKSDVNRGGALSALLLAPDLLSDAAIVSIEEQLGPPESLASLTALVQLLVQTKRPAARDVLIRLASHSHPRVWRQTLFALEPPMRVELARTSAIVGERLLWLTGESEDLTEAQRAVAWSRLPGQITSELKAQDLGSFVLLYRSMTRHVDPMLATPAIIRLLQAHEVSGRDHLWMAQAIRQLNLWHRTNFGGLGTDADSPDHPGLEPEAWAALVAQVTRWWGQRPTAALQPGP